MTNKSIFAAFERMWQYVVSALEDKADKVTDKETIAALIDADMLPAVQDSSGAILTDADGNIVLRY